MSRVIIESAQDLLKPNKPYFTLKKFAPITPLTTNAESYLDLPEIFAIDFSNFLKNKMFLFEFFPSRGYQDIRNFCFFLFLTVWTYFLSDFYQNFLIALRTVNLSLLKYLRYL